MAQGSGSWPWDGNSPDIIKAIGWLKHDKIALAHPIPVVLQEAEEKIVSMKHIYPGCQFGIINEFIGSSMKAMLEKGGLQHMNLILHYEIMSLFTNAT